MTGSRAETVGRKLADPKERLRRNSKQSGREAQPTTCGTGGILASSQSITTNRCEISRSHSKWFVANSELIKLPPTEGQHFLGLTCCVRTLKPTRPQGESMTKPDDILTPDLGSQPAATTDSPSSMDALRSSDTDARAVTDQTVSESGNEAAETGAARSGAVKVGSRLGPYHLVRKLGQGGMGAVYEARHTKLDKTFALKVLPPEFASSVTKLTRFEREMKAVGKLDHPNIIKATNADEFNGTHYLVMEFVEGIDLADLVKERGVLAVRDACKVIRQAALGLQHAHEHGLVHRDIKPSNLFLTKSGQVKLLDLGLARLDGGDDVNSGLTTLGQMLGTPDYMAPEQWDDTRSVDARADLYALGCTLCYLLTGKAPFDTGQPRSFLHLMKVHSDAPPPDLTVLRPSVPADLNVLFQRLLAKRPEDRFATAAEVAAKLEPFFRRADTTRPQHVVPAHDLSLVLNAPPIVTTPRKYSSPSCEMEFAMVPAGKFNMGSSADDVRDALQADSTSISESLKDEQPQHPVWITQAFYMGVYEVTQIEFQSVLGRNPSSFSPTGSGSESVFVLNTCQFPVECVTWFDAIEFCNKLSEADGLAPYYLQTDIRRGSGQSIENALVTISGGIGYRLPTEAEWEYACRANTTTPFHFGRVLNGDKANVNGNCPFGTTTRGPYQGRTTAVDDATYPQNAFGLVQMHGNVWEWCEDVYDEWAYAECSQTTWKADPLVTSDAEYRVLRGGSWGNFARNARSASRGRFTPNSRYSLIGFRVVRSLLP